MSQRNATFKFCLVTRYLNRWPDNTPEIKRLNAREMKFAAGLKVGDLLYVSSIKRRTGDVIDRARVDVTITRTKMMN